MIQVLRISSIFIIPVIKEIRRETNYFYWDDNNNSKEKKNGM